MDCFRCRKKSLFPTYGTILNSQSFMKVGKRILITALGLGRLTFWQDIRNYSWKLQDMVVCRKTPTSHYAIQTIFWYWNWAPIRLGFSCVLMLNWGLCKHSWNRMNFYIFLSRRLKTAYTPTKLSLLHQLKLHSVLLSFNQKPVSSYLKKMAFWH